MRLESIGPTAPRSKTSATTGKFLVGDVTISASGLSLLVRGFLFYNFFNLYSLHNCTTPTVPTPNLQLSFLHLPDLIPSLLRASALIVHYLLFLSFSSRTAAAAASPHFFFRPISLRPCDLAIITEARVRAKARGVQRFCSPPSLSYRAPVIKCRTPTTL